MNHPVETFGFRVEHAGWRLAYSGDTGESDALVRLAEGADLLLCEASFLDGPHNPPNLHLTARQAAEHAARAGVGQLLLTHLVPWNDRDRTLAEASQAYRGPLSLATSGLVLGPGTPPSPHLPPGPAPHPRPRRPTRRRPIGCASCHDPTDDPSPNYGR